MEEFITKIGNILEQDNLQATDELSSFPQWDSLAVLSVIAMLDANYGVNLRANDLATVKTAGELWKLVQSKKG
jgi:acyl carrier protein